VYASDALLMAGKVKVALQVATTTPIHYPMAKVASSTKSEDGLKFMAFVMSNAGQSILKKHGFAPP
jgi:molybdate transport system substrate-binding protein